MLGYADYAVLAATLAVSAAIGLYYRFTGGRQKTDDEYILADRSASVAPVAFSLMASFMSAITLLGVTRENYSYGTQFVAINLSYGLGTVFSAHFYLPVFFRLQEKSAYAYLERRFGRKARLLASLSFSLQMVLYMGIVLHAPVLALSAVTGLSYLAAILVVGAACTFYSVLGGIKAVLATDVFQSILMFAAIFAVIIRGSHEVGGAREVLRIASERGRIEFFNLSADPTARHTLWTQIVGGMFVYCSIYAVNQAQVQRLLTLGTLKKSQLSLWVSWPILTLLSLSTSFAGLTVFAYYKDCDPVAEGRISKGDQLLPLFVTDTMSDYPGLSGLFVAGIFSGSLSTVSSAINSLAAVTLEDYVKPCVAVKKPTLVLKTLALAFGVICVGIAFLAEHMGPGVLQASLTIFGVVGGPLLGLFTLGMAFPKANQSGALLGTATSLAFLFWIGFGQPKPPAEALPVSVDGCANKAFNETVTVRDVKELEEVDDPEYFYLYRISYAWYAAIGFCMTVTLGLIASLITARTFNSEDDTEGKVVDTELFMDVVPRAWIKAGIIDKGGEGGGAARSGGGGGGAELQELSPLPCTAEGPDDPSNASELKEV